MRAVAVIAIIYLTAMTSQTHAQDFDPTEQILPFTQELQLIGDGDFAEAIDALAAQSAGVQQAIADLNIDWDTVERSDPRLSPWLTGVINLNVANYLYCQALGKRMGDAGVTDTCIENWDRDALATWCLVVPRVDSFSYYRIEFDDCLRGVARELDVIQTYLWLLATALVLEAEGKIETAKESFLEIRPFIHDLWHYELHLIVDLFESTSAYGLLEDYLIYRRNRLRLLSPDNQLFSGGAYYGLRDCPTGGGEHCPAASAALRAMSRYVLNFRTAAASELADALTRPQYWLGLDAYEHPLFWLAALGHREGARTDVAYALSYQFDLGDMATPDVRYVLDLYAGAADYDGTIPDVCDTAGCRYFLAQYLYGLDRIDDGHAVVRQGNTDCEDTASLMCAVLRFANRKVDAGKTP